uniref:Na(+)/H(+) exchange regulatory cofactor NHE-RF n=1 Tax=Sander lucioperca TaxID=283035 RepID=A0A8C9YW55_SANLU
MSELRPRLCFLTKGERGYGFHLHGERNKGGQFIRKVEPGSSSDLAGLRPGDRVVEVNGENVENESHHQVVERIREVEHRTRLLVIDRDTDDYFRSRGLACTEDLAIEMGTLSPQPSPRSTPSNSPLPRENSTLSPLSPKPNHTHSFSPPLLPRLCHLVKGEHGYGFNLHSDKKKGGQFVRSVDPGSAAVSADIRPGDRLVNGVNIEGLRHSEVVLLIRAGGEEVRLLVVDQETDNAPPTPSSTTELHTTDPPIINVTLTDSPITNTSPKSWVNGSSASHSSRSSTTQSEISSSDMSIQVPDEDDRRGSDPFLDSGLRLSPTAAEAKQKALASRNKKRAPVMDWNTKYEIFSSF